MSTGRNMHESFESVFIVTILNDSKTTEDKLEVLEFVMTNCWKLFCRAWTRDRQGVTRKDGACLFRSRKNGVPDDGAWEARKRVGLDKWIKDKLSVSSWSFLKFMYNHSVNILKNPTQSTVLQLRKILTDSLKPIETVYWLHAGGSAVRSLVCAKMLSSPHPSRLSLGPLSLL